MTNGEQNNYTNKKAYAHIADRIKTTYNGEITESEAYEAARNLIGLSQEIIDYKVKKQRKE